MFSSTSKEQYNLQDLLSTATAQPAKDYHSKGADKELYADVFEGIGCFPG